VNGWEPKASIHPAAEAALAFLAGVAFFVLAAAAIPVRDIDALIVLLGVIYLCVVLVAARRLGPLYAVPLAIAGGLAFDSFYIPPTRNFGAHDWQNWLVVAIYISMGVLIGMLGAYSQRRGEASERARSVLADEQAALRRVATLVAREVPPPEVFAAVAREVGQLLGVDATHIGRFEPGGLVIGVASWSREGSHVPIGTQLSLEGPSVTAAVSRSGRPARMDSYEGIAAPVADAIRELGIRSSVGVPIVVEGRPWGVMAVSSKGHEPLPADTEARTAHFTELVAMAISNTEARAEVKSLADEQAALRRVATLVAHGVPASELFGAVAEEVGRLLGTDLAGMIRYETDDTATPVATWAAVGEHPDVGGRWPLERDPGLVVAIARTRRPARIDDYEDSPGRIAAFARDVLGIRSSVGGPIVVEGRLWGALVVHSTHSEPLPADTESRLMNFTELIATAIANTDSRTQLTASRARVLAAADDARRRVVRDLHDGAQQRMVHTLVMLKQAQRALREGDGQAESLLGEALVQADEATEELRELAHGILPSVLAHGGLRSGVNALASRMHLPLTVDVPAERFPPAIEASAYFVVAEALTNVAKHSHAERAEVKAWVDDAALHVEVRDDGVGGAKPDRAGLVGLDDRVAALGGRLDLESPRGGGTRVAATLPLPV
jgi:signal transduction histidine kinase